jgi:hypothetical protein
MNIREVEAIIDKYLRNGKSRDSVSTELSEEEKNSDAYKQGEEYARQVANDIIARIEREHPEVWGPYPKIPYSVVQQK